MRPKIRISKNDIPALYIAAYYAIQILNSVTLRLFQNTAALRLVMLCWTYLLLVLILLKMHDSIKIFVITELFTGIAFFASACMGNLDDAVWMAYYRRVAFAYIPLAVTAYNVVDRKKLLRYLHIISVIAIPAWFLTAYLSYSSWDSSYDMGFGYNMMLTALVLLANFSIYYHIMDIILAALICPLVLFVGSRGSFICLLAFVMVQLFLSKQYDLKRKTLLITAIAILSIVVVLNIDNILLFADQVSQSLGFNSRSLKLLMQGRAISQDAGRIVLWKYFANLINERPILGYGVVGGWSNSIYKIYPHNIILEFILSFGYPIGLILFLVVLVIMLNGIRCKNKYNSAIAILFVSFCMHLFVSHSYLVTWQFFVCIGLCLPQTYSFKMLRPRENDHDSTRENCQFSTALE